MSDVKLTGITDCLGQYPSYVSHNHEQIIGDNRQFDIGHLDAFKNSLRDTQRTFSYQKI